MSGEKFVIQIDDKIPNEVVKKIKDIGTYSKMAATAIDRLDSANAKAALTSERLFQAEAKSSTALEALRSASLRTASAQESLKTAKLKSVSASDMAYVAENKLLTSIQNLSAAEIKATLAQENLNQAKIKTSIASQNLIKAENLAAISAEKLKQEQVKTKIATENLSLAQSKLSNEQNKGALTSQKLKTETAKTSKEISNSANAATRAAAAQARLDAAQRRVAASGAAVGTSMGSMLKRGLIAVGATLGVQEILQLGNSYVDLQNKLRVVTTSEEQLAQVSSRVFDIANKTRTPVEETAKAFSRFDLALIQLGGSQEETLKMTETINKALIVSGANTGEQSAALLQLSQAFNKGKLDGDEFRTVMELMPTVADAIAKQMGVARGELLKLAPQGKITADIMRKALSAAADEIDAKFSKTVPTLNQSLTILKNKAIEALGEIEKRTGALSSLAENITAFSVGILSMAPETAMIVGFFKDLNKEVVTLVTGSFKAGDGLLFMRRTLQGLGFILAAVVESFERVNLEFKKRDVIEYAEKTSKAIARLNELKAKGASTFELQKATNEVLILTNLGIAAAETATKMQAGEFATERWTRAVEESEKAVKSLNSETDKLRPGDIKGKKPGDNKVEIAMQESRARILQKITDELNKEANAFGLVGSAREIYLKMSEIEIKLASARIGKNKEKITLLEKERDAFVKLITDNENNKRTQSELNRINEEANGPLEKLNATLEASSILLTQGTINQEQFNRQILIAKNIYISSVDPLLELNKSLKDEAYLLGFVGQAQQIENRMQQITNDLHKNGIILTKEQDLAYRSEIQAILQKNMVNQEQNKIYDELIGKGETFKAQITALQLLMQSGMNGLDLSTAKTTLFGSMFDGTQEMFDTELKQYQTFYDQIKQLRAADLISEKTAFQLKMKADQQFNQKRLEGASQFFGSFAVLQKSGSRQLFEIGKAAAIAQATIDGIAGVQKALSAYPPPWSFAMAAAVGVVTASNVAQIASTQFGGGFEKGGLVTGSEQLIRINEKGNEFVVNAQATARNRPALEAMNAGKKIGSTNSNPQLTVKIENYGTSKEFEIQQINEEEVRIIARDEAKREIFREVPSLVGNEIGNPNSAISKSLGRNTSVSRRRG